MFSITFVCKKKKKKVVKRNDLITNLWNDIVIKKIKDNDFKKNMAYNETYICMEKHISVNTRLQLIIDMNVQSRKLF